MPEFRAKMSSLRDAFKEGMTRRFLFTSFSFAFYEGGRAIYLDGSGGLGSWSMDQGLAAGCGFALRGNTRLSARPPLTRQ